MNEYQRPLVYLNGCSAIAYSERSCIC